MYVFCVSSIRLRDMSTVYLEVCPLIQSIQASFLAIHVSYFELLVHTQGGL